MCEDKLPTLEYLREQIENGKKFFAICREFSPSNQDLGELEDTLVNMDTQLTELENLPFKFNNIFSEEGWIAHDTMDFNILKLVLEKYEKCGFDEAESLIIEYFDPDNLEKRLFFLNHVEELRLRKKFIDFAMEDYKLQKYHSVIPMLLMILDGAVNDALGKGLHAKGIEMNAWDTITTADGSINEIKKIFQKERKKTRDEPIKFPYRNGILHGRDLGFDNIIVAAKSWCR